MRHAHVGTTKRVDGALTDLARREIAAREAAAPRRRGAARRHGAPRTVPAIDVERVRRRVRTESSAGDILVASALERRELKRHLARVVDRKGCAFHLSKWTRRPVDMRSTARRCRVVDRRCVDDARKRAIAGAIAVATDVVVAM